MHPDVEELERKSHGSVTGDQVRGREPPVPRLADLLEQVEVLLRRFIVFPSESLPVVIACWIAGTYVFRLFSTFGYVALRSATPQCGKSHLLRLMALLAKGNPPITMIPTAATLFRSTREVLMLDEVDKLRNADRERYGEVMAVLNAGYEIGGIVQRLERKGGVWETKEFSVYGPKALAGIESLADSVTDRSFQIQMQRIAARMPRFNVRRLERHCEQIRDAFEAWAIQNDTNVEQAYLKLPDAIPALAGYDNRFQDIAEPLMVLASLADAERPDGQAMTPRLLAGFKAAVGRREPSNRERELLAFLQVAEAQLNGMREQFVASKSLLDACQDREDLSGIESTRALAGFLKHFDLYPKSAGNHRGYDLSMAWVQDWRERYKGSDHVG